MSSLIDTNAPAPENRDVLPVRIWRFSVNQYHEMLRARILGEDDAVELLDGLLVQKMVKNPPHRISTVRVRRALDRLLPQDWHAQTQDPITLPTSEPEPDASVVRGDPGDYPDSHPGPGSVALVVEVADASLEQDRGLKKELYAQAGIATYWIINLIDRCVEAYSDPTGRAARPDFRFRQDYRSGDAIPLLLDGKELGRIPVAELLP